MARTIGSVGLTKRNFESDFNRYCDDNDFSPGWECARLMEQAAKDNNTQQFVQLGVLHAKNTAPGDTGSDSGQLPLVIERRRESNAA